jgi:rare lipoprotein A
MVARMSNAPRPALHPFLLLLVLAVLAGCASGPLRGIVAERDGAEANPPPGLAQLPDAQPRLEPIRAGGPNKPYDVLGHSYVPITQDAPFAERGLASWYGRKFQGKRTSSGELYDMYAMTAAHPTLPIPSYVRVRNPANGREIVVRVNDRGPFHSSRIIDLSYTAALKLDVLRGVTPVEISRITFDEIRAGSWKRDDAAVLAVAAPDTVPTAMEGDLPPAPAPAATPLAGADTSAATGPLPVVLVQPLPVAEAAKPVADAPAGRAFTGPARGYWVQLGAFRQRDGAETFHQRVIAELDWLAPLLAVFSESSLYRLQAGPYPSREEAHGVAERVRGNLQLVPTIVERR